MRTALLVLAALLLLFLVFVWLAGSGRLGRYHDAGAVTGAARPAVLVAEREETQREAGAAAGAGPQRQILFGDLHVHSTYSTDAFLMSLPAMGGDGAHPVADACDFARHCAALDFWAITDHGLAVTPRSWEETAESIRQCNAVAADPSRPDVAAFLGWEWTQVGTTAENHWGHKNVILRHTDPERIPTHAISSLDPALIGEVPGTLGMGVLGVVQPSRATFDLIRYFRDFSEVPLCPKGVPVRELPRSCRDFAPTPAELFAKLDEWGHEALVIPHGTTWGFYTPLGSSWEKQLRGAQHDPSRQTLVEVFSGHGNSEEYRDWEEVGIGPDGSRSCPEARSDYLPSCRQAGRIIRERCLEAGESAEECESRAARARQLYVEADVQGHFAVPGADPDDWLDAGQCRDCFQPAFNYRPRSSVQYMMALRDFGGEEPRRFRFGFLASSDNHSARPGTGYKEYDRTEMTEARFGRFADSLLGGRDGREPAARATAYEPEGLGANFFGVRESERQASFFLTGGLVAVHADGRDHQAVWDALRRRETYGTSGPRILLWFDLRNAPGGQSLPMGSAAVMREAPLFTVRAVGSLEQTPGCGDAARDALAPERLERLCRGECYRPSDRRRAITRVEVVRIRPRIRPGEPVAPLVEDPWKVLPCPGDPEGCVVHFEDPSHAEGGRDAVYYVRAIEAPSLAVAADPLACERDASGACVAVSPCAERPADDDCLAETEERAWSSPIFVDWPGEADVAAAP